MTYADSYDQPRPSPSLQMMALVQGQQYSSTAQQCRRLRPRGRQRPLASCCWSVALLSLLTILHILSLISAEQVVNSTPVPTPTLVKDASGTPSWRRIGLSEAAVRNNEQELINKILRDDTSSSVPTSFQYTRLPATAVVVTPLPSLSPATVTKSDTDRLPVPNTAPASSPTTTVNGKINQSRSKEEQEAFNKRQSSVNTSQAHQDQSLRSRRRRRAVNVVVNTFSGEESDSGSRKVHQSLNSNFLLKTIVTGIENCLRDMCRDKFHSLSTSDIPQLLANSSVGGKQNYTYVNVLTLRESGLRTLPHRTMAAIADKLPNIEFIDLSINQLKSANLALSGPLAFLNFSQNQLTRFHLRSGRNSSNALATLDLSHNNLTGDSTVDGKNNRMDVGMPSIVLGVDCANLTMLDLSHNRLRDLSFLHNPDKADCPVRVLNLAYNQLHGIKRDTFATTPNLEILSLAHNFVAEIENDTFAHLQHLQYLDLGDNLLNASCVRALQGIPDLIGLSLARNPQLGDALQGFVASWSLKELDLSATGLCDIPAALAQSVRTLNLAHNHFQVIRSGDLDSYPLLFNLDISHCSVAEIEDDALGRLEMLATLNLNHNHLRQVPISLPVNLMALHLENNNIMELQANRFAHLTNLKVLSLSGNKIQYLPALPLRKLLVLNLVSAELHGLSQLVVQTSPHLKDLRLDNNPVKCSDLLGIAEWATPCRDVEMSERAATMSTSSDYDELDDAELRELAEENERNNLKYLLDYVASKGQGADNDGAGEWSRQLSTTSQRAQLCRSSPTTSPTPVHLNAQVTTPKAATLLWNKSPSKGVPQETDTSETEQISSNLPNPPIRQTVTTPAIIKTLPLLPLRSTDIPPSSQSAPAPRASKTSGNAKEGILPHRQNNGSLQITGHLNTNKRNEGDDGTAVENEGAAATQPTKHKEILADNRETKAKSIVLADLSTVAAAVALPSNETEAGKSSASVPIKLAYNKNANSALAYARVSNKTRDGGDDDVRKKSKKLTERVNNKKLIKLTDSSSNRKLMPFIGQNGQRRRITSGGGDDGVFAQQSIPSPATVLSTAATRTTENNQIYVGKTPPMTSTLISASSHVTSSPTFSIAKGIPSTKTTTTSPPSAQLITTLSPAVFAEEKSLPISSKQIIFQRLPQIMPTRDDVHKLLSGEEEKNLAPSTLATNAAAVPPTALRVVNETRDMRKNLPKTVATPSTESPAASSSPLLVAKPTAPAVLRNDDDTVVDNNEKLVANGKIMRQTSPVSPTQGLIEGTLVEEENDNDNPLLELWQQASTHLSSSSHTTISPGDVVARETKTMSLWPPEANPDALLPVSPPSNTQGDVNERKNLIRTKTDNNKATIIPESPADIQQAKASLKSETILINDRNNDASVVNEGNSAGAHEKNLQHTENEDSDRDVLKLNSQMMRAKENGKIYVAENSLSVAELVLLATTPTADPAHNSHPNADSNNARSYSQTGDTNRRRRPDKLSQLNTNSIHVDGLIRGEEDAAQAREIEADALSGGVVVGGSSRPTPWNEHIKDDGRRRNENTNEDVDNNTDGDAYSDNYLHRQPHPGLFIVIGATIGIVLSIGLFRCKQSWWPHRHYPLPDTGDINQAYTDASQRHMTQRQFDYHQQRMATRPSTSATERDATGSLVDNVSARQQRSDGSDDDYYRCTNWRDRVETDSDKCDGETFVDVQLTPKAERKSVKFDLLPMKILSPTDHQPFYPIMTTDCDYDVQNNNSSLAVGNSSCDMGARSVALERGNKSSSLSSSTSPLELW